MSVLASGTRTIERLFTSVSCAFLSCGLPLLYRAGRTTANLPGITDRQWGKHGGWVDGSAAQTGYVLDSADNALAVPKALAL